MCANRRVLSDVPGARRFIRAFAVLLAVAPAMTSVGLADTEESQRRSVIPGPVQPAEDPGAPRRHFRANNPASLNDEDAERIYADLKSRLEQAYRRSGDPSAIAYQGWTRYNTAPYRSASHGNRFINNFANDKARSYGRYEEAGRLPVGSVVVKDSFTVSEDGTVTPGPLFVMEKMETGFNYVSGNWRYIMVEGDGTLFGVTKGPGSKKVEFCIGCHLAVEEQDHLHFIPAEYRRR